MSRRAGWPRRFRWCGLIALIAVAAGGAGLAANQERGESPPGAPTVVLLVRHAEKEATPKDDPPLTEAGKARAASLSRFAKDAGVQAIYATPYLRTRGTVEPLASHLKIEITTLPAADIGGLARDIKTRRAGGVVLVAGHSNTIPDIIATLGGGPVPAIAETEFDNLYMVTIAPGGGAKTVRLHLDAGAR